VSEYTLGPIETSWGVEMYSNLVPGCWYDPEQARANREWGVARAGTIERLNEAPCITCGNPDSALYDHPAAECRAGWLALARVRARGLSYEDLYGQYLEAGELPDDDEVREILELPTQAEAMRAFVDRLVAGGYANGAEMLAAEEVQS
jgi:hypothetical protein